MKCTSGDRTQCLRALHSRQTPFHPCPGQQRASFSGGHVGMQWVSVLSPCWMKNGTFKEAHPHHGSPGVPEGLRNNRFLFPSSLSCPYFFLRGQIISVYFYTTCYRYVGKILRRYTSRTVTYNHF